MYVNRVHYRQLTDQEDQATEEAEAQTQYTQSILY
jgi:hypothetical protein